MELFSESKLDHKQLYTKEFMTAWESDLSIIIGFIFNANS